MVERWWGRRGVYAEDFAGLVRAELRGIRTTDLAAAARGRGWNTRAFDATPLEVRRLVADGVPVIALIEVAPERYHYVVVLAWAEGRVTFHDPARAPSRSIDEASFLEQWTGAERWAMVIRPAEAVPSPSMGAPVPLPVVDSMPCRPWIDQALDAVDANRLGDAADLLGTAGAACPREPLVLRELGAVRFRQGRLGEAVDWSSRYVARVPGDSLGWSLLAAAQYLSGDRQAALRAWNTVGLPRVDLVRIDGVRQLRFGTIADAVDVPHGTVLTPARLALARRRLDDLGALRRSVVDYQPVDGGRAEVRVVVVERPVLGSTPQFLAINTVRALTQHAVRGTISAPLGVGDVWSGAWRWDRAHPRIALGVALPLRLGISGLMSLESVREKVRFSVDTAAAGMLEESRRASHIVFGGWITPAWRPFGGLGFERWSGGRSYLDATAGAEFRGASDRLVITTSASHAQALSSHASWSRGSARALWSSGVAISRRAWSARLGLDLASRGAPIGAWPMATEDDPWVIPLRAHRRTSDGQLPGAVTGRGVVHGGVSGDQPIARAGPLTLAVGVFLDGARVMEPMDRSGGSLLHLDAGGGIRIAVLDGQLGVVRVDLATGLTDHRSGITVGLHQSWPPFRRGEPRP
jgi:hypothetical protein